MVVGVLVEVWLAGAAHELIETLPELRDSVVFFGHSEHLFEFAIEDIG